MIALALRLVTAAIFLSTLFVAMVSADGIVKRSTTLVWTILRVAAAIPPRILSSHMGTIFGVGRCLRMEVVLPYVSGVTDVGASLVVAGRGGVVVSVVDDVGVVMVKYFFN